MFGKEQQEHLLVTAKDVVGNPALLDAHPGPHMLLRDESPIKWGQTTTFDDLVLALDLLAARGWLAVSISSHLTQGHSSIEMFALLRREPGTTPKSEAWPYEG